MSTAFTGYFRDGETRVDLVVVAKENKILRRYLTAIIKGGFSVEIETGKMSIHRHLLFVKIHATEVVIERYGEMLFYAKHFKEMHCTVMPDGMNATPLFKKLTWHKIMYENAFLGIMRENYPHPKYFSPLERSKIVNDLLLSTRFGAKRCCFFNTKRVSIKMLMHKGVVLDMYALHDGPYFALQNQSPINPNGRQILFAFWTGLRNIIRMQPLNIINEYFGERVGFFFAFYGLYNFALIFLALVGIITFMYDWFTITYSESTMSFCSEQASTYYPIGSMDVWRTTAASWDHEHWARYEHMYYVNDRSYPLELTLSEWTKNFWFCPNCRHYLICPHRHKNEICEEAKLNDHIETHNKLIFLPLFCFVWAAIFIKLLKRTENFYAWMWEVDSGYISSTLKCNIKGLYYKADPSFLSRMWTFMWNIILLVIIFVSALLMLYYLLQYRYYLMMIFHKYRKLQEYANRKYYVMMYLGITNMAIVFVLERLGYFVLHKMIYLEQLESHQEQQNAMVRRHFAISFIFTFVLITYVAFVKGQFNTTPIDKRNLKFLGGILMDNCDPLTCIDEVLILIIAILFMREIVFKFLPYIKLFYGYTSDYSTIYWYNQWPFWERERFLMKDSETEEFLQKKYKEIVMQFATVILFIAVCPLAPALALFVNALDIRYCARRFLLYTRRPLLQRSVGIGPWRDILVFLVFLMGLFGTLIVTVTSDTLLKINSDISTETDVFDHIGYSKDHVTFPLFTQVNGPPGDVDEVIKIGHIPLALFPEYDYEFIRSKDHYHNDKALENQFERYVRYKPNAPCYGWYNGCHFKNKLRWGCMWQLLWGENFSFNSTFSNIKCTLVYDTTVRKFCYMKGFIKRYSSVTKEATKMYHDDITVDITTFETSNFSDEHLNHSYGTTWSTTSESWYEWKFTWNQTYYSSYTTSWFDTSLFRSWYYKWFKNPDGKNIRILPDKQKEMHDFMGTNITAFYSTTWIYVPYWVTSWFSTWIYTTGYYWSWAKTTQGMWIHDYSSTLSPSGESWNFSLEYYADVFHSYGYGFNWQQMFINHQKWWYTVVTVTLLTIVLVLIYGCWPDTSFEVSELFAIEKEMDYVIRKYASVLAEKPKTD